MVLAGLSCGGSEPAAEPSPDAAPVELRVETLSPSTRESESVLIGSVAAQRRVTVAARILSNVTDVKVAEGQAVRAGQTVIELDDREMRSALNAVQAARAEAESAGPAAQQAIASAQAGLDLAKVTHGRFQTLLDQKSVSPQEFDEAAARLKGAQAAVEMARAQLAQIGARRAQADAAISQAETRLQYAVITAPVNGYVIQRLVDPGAMAAPGTPLLEIEQSGGYRLEISVPESRLASLRSGQTMRVEIEALGSDGLKEGQIVEIVPSVDPGSRTFLVKLALPAHPGLRSGLYGRAFLPGAEQQTLTVPAEAVDARGQLRSVFVVESDRAVRRLVTLGRLENDRYEILSGLQAGDRVVLEPQKVVDGAPATAREATR